MIERLSGLAVSIASRLGCELNEPIAIKQPQHAVVLHDRGEFFWRCTSGNLLVWGPRSGEGEKWFTGNARVPADPFLSASTVSVPLPIASTTKWRLAVSNARRQAIRQNRCALPPSVRGSKHPPHQRHALVFGPSFRGIMFPSAREWPEIR
jgi:hypothetical protein